jgi:hypothetical protein
MHDRLYIFTVIPAKAGIQSVEVHLISISAKYWFSHLVGSLYS